MYNSEIKEKFISECAEVRYDENTIETFFIFSEKYEREVGKDLGEMDENEIELFLKSISGVYAATNYRTRILELYSQWYLDKGLPNATNAAKKFLSIGKKKSKDYLTIGAERMLKSTVVNPKDLQRLLDSYLQPDTVPMVDCVHRCYFWFAFAGIERNLILEIRNRNIDFKNKVIRLYNQEYPIYDESVNALKMCVSCKEFLVPNNIYTVPVFKERPQDDIVLRGTSIPSIITLKGVISHKSKELRDARGVGLTYKNVALSGLFYRVFENEQRGLEPDFHDNIVKNLTGDYSRVEYQRMYSVFKGRYLRAYETWKYAHGLK